MNSKGTAGKARLKKLFRAGGMRAYLLPFVMIAFGLFGASMLRSSSALSCSGSNVSVESRPETSASVQVWSRATASSVTQRTPFCLSAYTEYRLTFEASNSANYGFGSWYFSSNGTTSTSKEIFFFSKNIANSTVYLNLAPQNTYPTPYATPPAPYPTPKTYPTPKSIQGPSTQVTAIPEDKTPPTVPSDFRGEVDSGGFVRLSWTASVDDKGIEGYELERSEDRQRWDRLGGIIKETSFTDDAARFGSLYTYRLRAVDTNENVSDYVTTDVSTAAFDANVTRTGGGVVRGVNDTITAEIPAEAAGEDVFCSINESSELVDTGNGSTVIAGPLQLACKTAAGNNLDKLDKPVLIRWDLREARERADGQIRIFALDGVKWSDAKAKFSDDIAEFSLTNARHFAAASGGSGDSLLLRIGLTLVVLLGLGGGILWALLIRYRRKQLASYNDYIKKHYGL